MSDAERRWSHRSDALDATRYSTTYKLATLLALIDVTARHTTADGTAPDALSAREVGARVIELTHPEV
jgi:hypothetical protein